MGGCCFTPKKTQLLWWYWLLLFSVVGIPMLVAALYVQRCARHGIIEKYDVRRASCIFWLGAFCSLLVMGLLLAFVVHRGWLAGGRSRDVAVFVVRFLVWLMVAVAAAKHSAKLGRWYGRLVCVLCYALVPAGLAWISWGVISLGGFSVMGVVPLAVMKFGACMLPAHYWHRFTTVPETKRAWLFLGGLACGAALFWVVSQYGYDVHAGLRGWLMATSV